MALWLPSRSGALAKNDNSADDGAAAGVTLIGAAALPTDDSLPTAPGSSDEAAALSLARNDCESAALRPLRLADELVTAAP